MALRRRYSKKKKLIKQGGTSDILKITQSEDPRGCDDQGPDPDSLSPAHVWGIADLGGVRWAGAEASEIRIWPKWLGLPLHPVL